LAKRGGNKKAENATTFLTEAENTAKAKV